MVSPVIGDRDYCVSSPASDNTFRRPRLNNFVQHHSVTRLDLPTSRAMTQESSGGCFSFIQRYQKNKEIKDTILSCIKDAKEFYKTINTRSSNYKVLDSEEEKKMSAVIGRIKTRYNRSLDNLRNSSLSAKAKAKLSEGATFEMTAIQFKIDATLSRLVSKESAEEEKSSIEEEKSSLGENVLRRDFENISLPNQISE